MGGILGVKAWKRVLFNVTGVSGDYASEHITFGVHAATNSSGEADVSFIGVTALIEGNWPAGAQVELWLPQVADSTLAASDRADANYFFSGQVLGPAGTALSPTGATASFGSATWPLAGWPGARIRVKSGGIPGAAYVSATAD